MAASRIVVNSGKSYGRPRRRHSSSLVKADLAFMRNPVERAKSDETLGRTNLSEWPKRQASKVDNGTSVELAASRIGTWPTYGAAWRVPTRAPSWPLPKARRCRASDRLRCPCSSCGRSASATSTLKARRRGGSWSSCVGRVERAQRRRDCVWRWCGRSRLTYAFKSDGL